MGTYSPVSGNDARSILAWVYPTAYALGTASNLNSTILTYGSETGGRRLHINLTGSGKVRVFYTSSRQYTIDTTLPTNEWSFVTMTLPNAAFQRDTLIYVNGVLQPGTASAPTDDIDTDAPSGLGFTIGKYSGQPIDFIGTIDEVAVFDRELTVYEIANLFLSAQAPLERATILVIR